MQHLRGAGFEAPFRSSPLAFLGVRYLHVAARFLAVRSAAMPSP
jgi:hypothetical protein